MPIATCTLQNIGPIEDFELNFDPHLTIVEGSSPSGKTQLIRALYTALTSDLRYLRVHPGGRAGEVRVTTNDGSSQRQFSIIGRQDDERRAIVDLSASFSLREIGHEHLSVKHQDVHLLTGDEGRLNEPIAATLVQALLGLEVPEETVDALDQYNENVSSLAFSERFLLELVRDFSTATNQTDGSTPLVVLDCPLGRLDEDRVQMVVDLIDAFSARAQILVTLTPHEAAAFAAANAKNNKNNRIGKGGHLADPADSRRSLLSFRYG